MAEGRRRRQVGGAWVWKSKSKSKLKSKWKGQISSLCLCLCSAGAKSVSRARRMAQSSSLTTARDDPLPLLGPTTQKSMAALPQPFVLLSTRRTQHVEIASNSIQLKSKVKGAPDKDRHTPYWGLYWSRGIHRATPASKRGTESRIINAPVVIHNQSEFGYQLHKLARIYLSCPRFCRSQHAYGSQIYNNRQGDGG